MKSSRKKRILATILCMVMVLTSNISALAEGDGLPDMTEQGVTAASVPETPVSDAEVPVAETQVVTEQPAQTPAEPVEEPATPDVPATPEVTPESTVESTPEVTPAPMQEQPTEETETTAPGSENTSTEIQENIQPTTDTTVPAPEVTPEATEDVFSEETELTQEFKDAQGQVVQKVTAKLPAGAFAAETSHITMEVQYLDEASENHIKNLMTKQLPQGDELGDYIALSVKFKVDGVETEALQPITITFEKSGLEIKDVKKANVFYYDPADPTVAGDQDELVEITQRNEMIENLQAAGQSTDNIEDYDLSSIEIKEENRSEKIQFEGRKSTIYGCYVEKTPEEVPVDIPVLNYEDDKVTVSVTAEEAGIIPEGAKLKVLPITSEDTDTKEQYKEVEKKIQEKVAEEEKEVAGFLAYDITLIDKDGNEMEPNGKVKVSMNYKKAELPPEVEEKEATDAEVTVLHLEEDENGEVKQVVDMGAEQKATVDTLATTEGTKVQNVEVETESFSVFTITWTSIIYFYYLNIQLINTEGTEVGNQNYEYSISEETSIQTLARQIKIDNYIFRYAVVAETPEAAIRISENNQITMLKHKRQSKWMYKKNNSWFELRNNEKVYFIYQSTQPTNSAKCYTENGEQISSKVVDLSKVQETTDLSGLAHSITNYEFLYVTVVKQNESLVAKRLRMSEEGLQYSTAESGDFWENVDSNEVRFIYRQTVGDMSTIQTADTSGSIDINLYDYETNDNKSGLIFNGGASPLYNQWIGYWKNTPYDYTKYNNDNLAVQGIMDRFLYDEQGNKVDVDDNYQGYPKVIAGSNNKIAYDLLNKPIASGLNHLFTKDADGYYEYDSSKHYAYYRVNGNPQRNFLVYSRPKDKGKDGQGDFMPLKEYSATDKEWYYGMTVGFNFIQPEEGMVNGKNMVFEFSGDDDVWVFVDGRLVLDIGGIHGAVSGKIDFATGAVQVSKAVNTTYSELSNTIGTNTTLKRIFNLSGNTFEDYTEHRVEFIYLERGAGESNCHLRFNMPPIRKDALQVRKEITNTDKEKYANVEFSFEVWLETEKSCGEDCKGCEVCKDLVEREGTFYKKLPDGTSYEIYKNETPTGKYNTIQNGVFKLKHGESAVFSEIERNLKYYAVEKEVSSDEFDEVKIPNWNVSYEDEKGNGVSNQNGTVKPGQTFIAKSDPKRVGGNSVIIFKNRCSSANQRELWITKKMAEGQTVDSNETFAFKVFLEGTDGTFVQYGAGSKYYVVDGEGTIDKLESQEVPSDGIIKGIKPGQSVVLTQILSGTEFRVEEVDLDKEVYYNPQKEVDRETCDIGTIEDENGTVISDGIIKLKKDAKVTITNKKRVNTFHIKKVDTQNETAVLPGAMFKLEKKTEGSWNVIEEELITDDQGMITVSDLENGNYRVTEIEAPEGYILEKQMYEFSLPYRGDNKNIIVEEESKLPDGCSYGEITLVVENKKKDWEIYKRSSSDKDYHIAGAEFELKLSETSEEQNNPTIYYGLSSSDENQKGKIVWYISKDYQKQINVSDMKAGSYIFKEIKAPNGYAISLEEWTIKLGENGILLGVDGNTVKEDSDNTKVTYYFENTPVYDLPSTGGPGIFVYTIGGTLLLMAAALLIYKMKREEVLKG
ncbi:MAG: SpaA isopeptide-forming pilin-related protein [Oliverpabstia sp.]|nr:SpaA isopeptide-forming pilin-related protein [Oliverpabstia sp.]